MTTRAMRHSDIPILREIHAEQGFDYPFPDLEGSPIEAVSVVVDENDHPLMAAYAERIIQVGLLCPPRKSLTAQEKVLGIKQLHDTMYFALKRLGYENCNAFLPPEVEKSFGRKLVRLFGWFKSPWKCYGRKL